jgi:hypothetical protein
MMLDAFTRASWIIGLWIATVMGIFAGTRAMGASLSTTALLIGLAIAPGIVVVLLAPGTPRPSVGDILYPSETTARRQ